MFVVHTLTGQSIPSSTASCSRTAISSTGLCFIFVIGIVLLATMALLPPMLQTLFGYPIDHDRHGDGAARRRHDDLDARSSAGWCGRVDARILVVAGLIAHRALALADDRLHARRWTSWPIVISGVIQGLGLGLVFVPLSARSPSPRLTPRFRTEAHGAVQPDAQSRLSVGISIVAALLAQNTQVNHAELAARVSPFNPALDHFAMPGGMSIQSGGVQALAYVNSLVTDQALMISYLQRLQADGDHHARLRADAPGSSQAARCTSDGSGGTFRAGGGGGIGGRQAGAGHRMQSEKAGPVFRRNRPPAVGVPQKSERWPAKGASRQPELFVRIFQQPNKRQHGSCVPG